MGCENVFLFYLFIKLYKFQVSLKFVYIFFLIFLPDYFTHTKNTYYVYNNDPNLNLFYSTQLPSPFTSIQNYDSDFKDLNLQECNKLQSE